MPFNTHWGNEAAPLNKSQFTQNYDHKGSPLPPPTNIYLVTLQGDYVIDLQEEKFVVKS